MKPFDLERGDALAVGGELPTAPAGVGRIQLLVDSLRRRWWWLLIGLGLAAAGALAVRSRTAAQFRAEAIIEVAPVLPHMIFTGEDWRAASILGFYDDYVRTLAARVRQRGLVQAAVDRLSSQGVAWLPPGVAPATAADHLRARLETGRIRDTYLMAVSLQDARPEILAPVVQAVVETFLTAMQTEAAAQTAWKAAALQEERTRMHARLGQVHERLEALAEQLGSALLDERQNIFFERVNVMEEGRTKVLVERARAEGERVAATERAVALLAEDVQAEVDSAMEMDPTVRDARTAREGLARELTQACIGLSERHPDRIAATERLARADADLEALITMTAARQRERVRRERQAAAARLLADARRGATAACESEDRIDGLMNGARAELREYGRAMREGLQLRREVEQVLDGMRRLDDELERVRVEARAPARTSLVSPAVEPLRPVQDRRNLLAGGLGGMLLFATLLAMYWAEARSPRLAAGRGYGRHANWLLDEPGVAAQVRELACRLPQAAFAMIPVDAGAATCLAPWAMHLATIWGRSVLWLGEQGPDGIPNAALAGWVERVVREPVERGGSAVIAVAEPLRGWSAVALARRVDHVLLVARVGRTEVSKLQSALDHARAAGLQAIVVAVPGHAPRTRN